MFSLEKVGDYCYLDSEDIAYFSTTDFLQRKGLPDSPEIRAAIGKMMKEIIPDLIVVTEITPTKTPKVSRQ